METALRVLLLLMCAYAATCKPVAQLETLNTLERTLNITLTNDNPEHQGENTDRKITPKSVFIAPKHNTSLLPDCPEGYKEDAMRRCFKPHEVDKTAQFEFLISKLQFEEDEDEEEEESYDEEQDGNNNPPTGGPLNINIPIGYDEEGSLMMPPAPFNGKFDSEEDAFNIKQTDAKRPQSQPQVEKPVKTIPPQTTDEEEATTTITTTTTNENTETTQTETTTTVFTTTTDTTTTLTEDTTTPTTDYTTIINTETTTIDYSTTSTTTIDDLQAFFFLVPKNQTANVHINNNNNNHKNINNNNSYSNNNSSIHVTPPVIVAENKTPAVVPSRIIRFPDDATTTRYNHDNSQEQQQVQLELLRQYLYSPKPRPHSTESGDPYANNHRNRDRHSDFWRNPPSTSSGSPSTFVGRYPVTSYQPVRYGHTPQSSETYYNPQEPTYFANVYTRRRRVGSLR